MGRSLLDLVIGIGLIVVGVLILVGRFGIEAILPYLGIVLIVVGVLILLGTLAAGKLIGIVSLVVGILLVTGFLNLPREMQQYMDIVNLVAGIVLVILGIQKLIRG